MQLNEMFNVSVLFIVDYLFIAYFSAVSPDKQVAPRTGFMHTFKEKEVLIKTWDPVSEGSVNS